MKQSVYVLIYPGSLCWVISGLPRFLTDDWLSADGTYAWAVIRVFYNCQQCFIILYIFILACRMMCHSILYGLFQVIIFQDTDTDTWFGWAVSLITCMYEVCYIYEKYCGIIKLLLTIFWCILTVIWSILFHVCCCCCFLPFINWPSSSS